jgi:peptidoglycan/LPS O-acetylase OafA/YrhL
VEPAPQGCHPTTRVFGLDLLRAAAILAVLLTHGQLLLPASVQARVGGLAGVLGALGVELFFVLSGFLIGSILLDLGPSFGEVRTLPAFWRRRWYRTLPAYWLFLGLTALATVAVGRPLPPLWPFLTFIQSWLWPHPAFFAQAWSLAVEEWFYLLFPLALYLLHRRITSFDRAFLLAAVLFMVLPTLQRALWAQAGVGGWDEAYRKVMFGRLDAIMFGVVAAWVRRAMPAAWSARPVRWLVLGGGLVLLFVAWGLARPDELASSFFAKVWLLPATSLGFALLLPAADGWRNGPAGIAGDWCGRIARWSYAMYLCNVLVYHAVAAVQARVGWTSAVAGWAGCGVFFVLVIAVSGLVYTRFEKPLTDLRDRPAGIRSPFPGGVS